MSTDDSNSHIRVGVTNRIGKTYNVIGTVVNYGLTTKGMVIRVCLDVENKIMTIYHPGKPEGEMITNLPEGSLYPAF